jgi:putative hydrolase of the HAD superfamily
MISTVIFDMDDTLYDEIDYCKSGFAAVAKYLSELDAVCKSETAATVQSIFSTLWSQFIAGNRQKTFNTVLEKLDLIDSSEMIAELVKIYREHEPDITLPAESRKVLETLRSQYKMALLTDGFLPAQQLKVKSLGIEKYFDCIIFTEELGRQFWKPSPVGFEKIVSELGSEPCQCVYIADNARKDFIAPNKLGFETIQMIRTNKVHTDVAIDENAAAGYTINTLTKLPTLLKAL